MSSGYQETDPATLQQRIDELEIQLAAQQQELAAARSESQFLREILDTLPTEIAVFDTELRHRFVNRQSLKNDDLRRWIIGKTDTEYCLERGKDLDIARRRDLWRRKAIRAKEPLGVEEELDGPDGEKLVFLRMHCPILDSQGEVIRLLGYSIDLTEHKRLEAQVGQNQRLESLSKLAGGLAHDFNNQLTAILGYCSLMQQDGSRDAEAEKYINEIQHAGERAAGLTGQLLAFSRRQLLEPRVFDLDRSLQEMADLLRRTIGDKVRLNLRAGTDLPPVLVDPRQIQQVILNLAINAREAMPEGGELKIKTRQLPLPSGTTELPLLGVELRISDTGVGMDEATRQQAFEPFFTTKPDSPGSGLGLSTAYGIVRQSGGDILLRSSPGAGTHIRILLPIDPQHVRPATAPTPRSGSETVLVTEDDDSIRYLASTFLTNFGYQVLTAANGQEALEICRSDATIDLLLTDVIMPGMNGPELVAEAHKERPDLRVLFMSGYPGDLDLGPNFAQQIDLLQKPFLSEALATRVRKALDRR